MHILWIIIIGFVVALIVKLVTPGENEPQGFILTTLLGILRRSHARQALGLYGEGPVSLERLWARC